MSVFGILVTCDYIGDDYLSATWQIVISGGTGYWAVFNGTHDLDCVAPYLDYDLVLAGGEKLYLHFNGRSTCLCYLRLFDGDGIEVATYVKGYYLGTTYGSFTLIGYCDPYVCVGTVPTVTSATRVD